MNRGLAKERQQGGDYTIELFKDISQELTAQIRSTLYSSFVSVWITDIFFPPTKLP